MANKRPTIGPEAAKKIRTLQKQVANKVATNAKGPKGRRPKKGLAKKTEKIGYAVDSPVTETSYPRGAKRASVKLRTGKTVSKTTTGRSK